MVRFGKYMVVGFKYDEAAGFTYLPAAAIRAEESRTTAPRCLASEGQTADLPKTPARHLGGPSRFSQ